MQNKMDEQSKKELLNLLLEMTYGFEEYQETLESDDRFWAAYSEADKLVRNL